MPPFKVKRWQIILYVVVFALGLYHGVGCSFKGCCCCEQRYTGYYQSKHSGDISPITGEVRVIKNAERYQYRLEPMSTSNGCSCECNPLSDPYSANYEHVWKAYEGQSCDRDWDEESQTNLSACSGTFWGAWQKVADDNRPTDENGNSEEVPITDDEGNDIVRATSSITITSPAGGTDLDLDVAVTLAAHPVFTTGTEISSIEVSFRANGFVIGTDKDISDGASINWTPVMNGEYGLQAEMVVQGVEIVSEVVTVTVGGNPANKPPVVVILSHDENGTNSAVAGDELVITASARDGDEGGTVSRVLLLVDESAGGEMQNKFQNTYTASYAIPDDWVGEHTITVVATDNAGFPSAKSVPFAVYQKLDPVPPDGSISIELIDANGSSIVAPIHHKSQTGLRLKVSCENVDPTASRDYFCMEIYHDENNQILKEFYGTEQDILKRVGRYCYRPENGKFPDGSDQFQNSYLVPWDGTDVASQPRLLLRGKYTIKVSGHFTNVEGNASATFSDFVDVEVGQKPTMGFYAPDVPVDFDQYTAGFIRDIQERDRDGEIDWASSFLSREIPAEHNWEFLYHASVISNWFRVFLPAQSDEYEYQFHSGAISAGQAYQIMAEHDGTISFIGHGTPGGLFFYTSSDANLDRRNISFLLANASSNSGIAIRENPRYRNSNFFDMAESARNLDDILVAVLMACRGYEGNESIGGAFSKGGVDLVITTTQGIERLFGVFWNRAFWQLISMEEDGPSFEDAVNTAYFWALDEYVNLYTFLETREDVVRLIPEIRSYRDILLLRETIPNTRMSKLHPARYGKRSIER